MGFEVEHEGGCPIIKYSAGVHVDQCYICMATCMVTVIGLQVWYGVQSKRNNHSRLLFSRALLYTNLIRTLLQEWALQRMKLITWSLT
jgi:hypothetical protein